MSIYIAPPIDGLYFTLSGIVDSYPPGDNTNPTAPGPSLVCVTSNVNTYCCRGSDNDNGGAQGNWLYPNGTMVLGNNANPNGGFTRSSHTQQIRLNRKRPDVMSPTAVYICEVPDESNTAITHRAMDITLTDSEYMLIIVLIFWNGCEF